MVAAVLLGFDSMSSGKDHTLVHTVLTLTFDSVSWQDCEIVVQLLSFDIAYCQPN